MCVHVCVCACTCTHTSRHISQKSSKSCLFLFMYFFLHIDFAYNTRDTNGRINRGVNTSTERQHVIGMQDTHTSIHTHTHTHRLAQCHTHTCEADAEVGTPRQKHRSSPPKCPPTLSHTLFEGSESGGRSRRRSPGPAPSRLLAPMYPSACASCLPPPLHPCAHILLPFHAPSSLPHPPCTIARHRQEQGPVLFLPTPCLLPPFTHPLPHGRSTTRHAPLHTHACLTGKVQRGKGGALGHTLRCQHSKVLGAHATTTTALPSHPFPRSH